MHITALWLATMGTSDPAGQEGSTDTHFHCKKVFSVILCLSFQKECHPDVIKLQLLPQPPLAAGLQLGQLLPWLFRPALLHPAFIRTKGKMKSAEVLRPTKKQFLLILGIKFQNPNLNNPVVFVFDSYRYRG